MVYFWSLGFTQTTFPQPNQIIVLPIRNFCSAELNQLHNWLSSVLQRFWLIWLPCHMHLERFTNPDICISPDFFALAAWDLNFDVTASHSEGDKNKCNPLGNTDMRAECHSNPCDSLHQRDGPTDRRCAILPSRQMDRWSVRQSQASASAFALWDFKWGVMCSQVCLYWPFHSSSKAIQLNQNWGRGGQSVPKLLQASQVWALVLFLCLCTPFNP